MEELLSIAQIARELRVSPQTIYKWERAGKFATVYRFGGRQKVYRSDFEAWRRSHVQPSLEDRLEILANCYEQFSDSAEKNRNYIPIAPESYARMIGSEVWAIQKQMESGDIDFISLRGSICIPAKKEIWEEFISKPENLKNLYTIGPLMPHFAPNVDLSENSQSSELS